MNPEHIKYACQLRDVGITYVHRPLANIESVRFDGDTVTVRITTYTINETSTAWIVKGRNTVMSQYERNDDGQMRLVGTITVPDEGFVPYVMRNRGRSVTVDAYLDSADWAGLCARPGASRFPMSHEAVTDKVYNDLDKIGWTA